MFLTSFFFCYLVVIIILFCFCLFVCFFVHFVFLFLFFFFSFFFFFFGGGGGALTIYNLSGAFQKRAQNSKSPKNLNCISKPYLSMYTFHVFCVTSKGTTQISCWYIERCAFILMWNLRLKSSDTFWNVPQMTYGAWLEHSWENAWQSKVEFRSVCIVAWMPDLNFLKSVLLHVQFLLLCCHQKGISGMEIISL